MVKSVRGETIWQRNLEIFLFLCFTFYQLRNVLRTNTSFFFSTHKHRQKKIPKSAYHRDIHFTTVNICVNLVAIIKSFCTWKQENCSLRDKASKNFYAITTYYVIVLREKLDIKVFSQETQFGKEKKWTELN